MDDLIFNGLIIVSIIVIVEGFRRAHLKVEFLTESLANEKFQNERLKNIVTEIVDTFGESGIDMHRHTYQKIVALSKAKTVLKQAERASK
jgi:hypothetical protein